MADAYAEVGLPGFKFGIPQPFTAQMFESVREVGACPVGFASQANQMFSETVANNMAAKIRAAIKNEQPLPGQYAMDTLCAAYDFSGTRGSGVQAPSIFDKIFGKIACKFIRQLLKRNGYKNMPAPVTVAKSGEEPEDSQISAEEFENLRLELVYGQGPWGENEAFINARNTLIEEARAEEAVVRSREQAVENRLSSLSF
jgi:hypothetical protein